MKFDAWELDGHKVLVLFKGEIVYTFLINDMINETLDKLGFRYDEI